MSQQQPTDPPIRIVITGGPAAGKDALLSQLRNIGLLTSVGEPAREIYRRHREQLGRHLQVGDRPEYSREVLQAFVDEYCQHKHGLKFFNRGIPDGYGWDRFFGLGPSGTLEEAARVYRYDNIFVLDPLDKFEDEADVVWAKEREISRVHELIVQGYFDAGYQPIFVPANSPEERAKFVLANFANKEMR